MNPSGDRRTAVFLHAHPDDEAILTGGTIAGLASAGHRVVLVVATRGELGEEPTGLLAPGQTLAHRRAAETRWSADILGIHRVECLGYRDSGMAGSATNRDPEAFCNADLDAVAASVATIVHEEHAEVLVTYDDHGGYGHPDHIQVHRVGVRVAAFDPAVSIYEATLNRDHLRRGMERLSASIGKVGADIPDLPEQFGSPEASITHTVDVRSFADLKRRAMAAHSSQIAETSFFLRLARDAFLGGFGWEWFIERSRGHRSGWWNLIDGLASSDADGDGDEAGDAMTSVEVAPSGGGW